MRNNTGFMAYQALTLPYNSPVYNSYSGSVSGVILCSVHPARHAHAHAQRRGLGRSLPPLGYT